MNSELLMIDIPTTATTESEPKSSDAAASPGQHACCPAESRFRRRPSTTAAVTAQPGGGIKSFRHGAAAKLKDDVAARSRSAAVTVQRGGGVKSFRLYRRLDFLTSATQTETLFYQLR